MDADNIPPLINSPAPDAGIDVPRWRWWVHLMVLTAFPLVVGGMGYVHADDRGNPALPGTVAGLISISLRELVLWSGVFLIAWLASRASVRQLLLKWRGGGKPVLWGLVYSVALRVAIAIVVLIATLFWFGIRGMPLSEIQPARSHIDRLMDATALTRSPLYFALTLTLISFVLGGLREELWRAGMLAGISALFPRLFASGGGRFVALLIVGVIFGLAHVLQGWGGVAMISLLGVGLGAIMLQHRSIWEAVLAHGFFDAGTFAVLYCIARFQS